MSDYNPWNGWSPMTTAPDSGEVIAVLTTQGDIYNIRHGRANDGGKPGWFCPKYIDRISSEALNNLLCWTALPAMMLYDADEEKDVTQ